MGRAKGFAVIGVLGVTLLLAGCGTNTDLKSARNEADIARAEIARLTVELRDTQAALAKARAAPVATQPQQASKPPMQPVLAANARAVSVAMTGPAPGDVVDLIIEWKDEVKSTIEFPGVVVVYATCHQQKCTTFALSPSQVATLHQAMAEDVTIRVRPCQLRPPKS